MSDKKEPHQQSTSGGMWLTSGYAEPAKISNIAT